MPMSSSEFSRSEQSTPSNGNQHQDRNRDREMRYTRLTQPLIRENGELRPASWDEALDRAASGFRQAVDKLGPDTFGIFACSKATNELNYIAQKFARQVIGTNNVDSCNRT